MEEFLKELNELCNKHNIYLTASGLIDMDWISATKAKSIQELIDDEDYCVLEDQFVELTLEGYKVVKQNSKKDIVKEGD